MTLTGSLQSVAAVALTAGFLLGGAHAQKWENPEGQGNVRIAVEDGTINWGTTPPWYALDQINSHCSSVGCHSGDTLYVGTEIVNGFDKQERMLELSIQASFSVNDDMGSLQELAEIAKSTSAQGYEVKQASHFDGNHCETAISNIGCDPKLHGDTPYVDQYYQFTQIHIRVDEGTGPSLLVKISLADAEGGEGWCANILGIGSTLAGVISGGYGAGLSLASLACGPLGDF